jgi:ribulose-5-phosphate 4-epimerase/fuculose-1-phosphate aldolase
MPLYMHEAAREGAIEISLTDAERNARVELAACYRIFDMLGWTEMIFNHITLRVPGPKRVFLINPFGLQYHEVTASNLVAVDTEGNPVRPGQHPINRAGFVVHSAIHGNVEGAHCVMHTHTTSGCAVAGLEEGLSHDSFYGALLHGRVAYHDFEGVTVNPEEQQRMLRSIGDKKVVVLRNHGLLSWGVSIQEAFLWLWTLQRACDVQIAAGSAGRVRRLQPSVLEQTSREAAAGERIVCDMVYAALKRKLDALGQDYTN